MKGFGGMQQMMKQANQMQKKIKKFQKELEEMDFDASSGGGGVKVKVTGNGIIKNIEVDKALSSDSDSEMIIEMVMSAANEAIGKSKEYYKKEMSQITGGMGGWMP